MERRTLTTVEVSRGTTHDGPGIRTTVFVKGCPLSCSWCQNPESINPKQEIWYEPAKCIGCMECAGACKYGALSGGGDGIAIDRAKCIGCCECAAVCPAKAMSAVGTVWTVDGLLREVLKDKHYYDEFGGGVTVSGGEPLLHSGFLTEFFDGLRTAGVHIALDTCGCAPRKTLTELASRADAALYDIKLADPAKHKELTGRDNGLILGNFCAVAELARQIKTDGGRCMQLWVRTPLIPGVTDTDSNIRDIADFLLENAADVLERWELCAFNRACVAKYAKMQLPWPYEGLGMMLQRDIDRIKALAVSRGFPPEKLITTGLVKQEK